MNPPLSPALSGKIREKKRPHHCDLCSEISNDYADNFFLPFARLAANTFLPPGVLILALKP